MSRIFGTWIPEEAFQCSGKGLNSRHRVFNLKTTFYCFLSQVLDPGASCREVLEKLRCVRRKNKLTPPAKDTSAYCQARSRLPIGRLAMIHEHIRRQTQSSIDSDQLYQGREVKVVDGTGVSMPDTPENQNVYPQPNAQKAGCGFPVCGLVASFSLATGIMLDWVQGVVSNHDNRLFQGLLKTFQKKDIILADRAFCSYANPATLIQLGMDGVMRLNQKRKTDLRQGVRLGPKDRLIQWTKPKQRSKLYCPDQWGKLPPTLQIRLFEVQVHQKGFRTKKIFIATTLTDPKEHTTEALSRLYFKRWQVEVFFRDIKVTLAMDVLRCKTPQMVDKEILMHVIGYNLIRRMMKQAAQKYQVELHGISFKGSVDTFRQWRDALENCTHGTKKFKELLEQFFESIAEDLLLIRPDRSEPRCRKRRPKNYKIMTKPRREMEVETHRGKRKK